MNWFFERSLNNLVLVRAAASEEEPELLLEGDAGDTIYERLPAPPPGPLSAPDFEDENWAARVTDWEEFWYDSDDVLDAQEPDGTAGSTPAGAAGLARAQALIGQLSDLRKRADVEQMIGPGVVPSENWESSFVTERDHADEVQMYRLDPNPRWSVIDARALAEKRAARAVLDAEWRRRQGLLSKHTAYTLRQERDVRLASAEFDWIREDWTDEQIQQLIMGGGKFVDPDRVQVGVLNPLLPADCQAAGVRTLPDTEEFLASIGLMATEDEILHLNNEIELRDADFVDPALVFEGKDGGVQMEAPVNVWAQRRAARDGAEVAALEALVDRMASRQRAREARAAAVEAATEAGEDAAAAAAAGAAAAAEAAAGGAPVVAAEAAAAAAAWDDLMGEGYSEFMEEDGLVFYDDADEDADEDAD